MNKLVKIPFQTDMRLAVRNGTKTATSRPYKMADVGDCFQIGEIYYQITNVTKMTLGEICLDHYNEEGCKSTQHFIEVWNRIHYNKGFIPTQIVFFHEFRKIG